MTNEQILKQAIEKAVKSGLDVSVFEQEGYNLDKGYCEKITYKEVVPELSIAGIYYLIFSHDFAKAFWGEKEVVYMQIVGGDSRHRWKAYEYHLMRMVLEKEPLLYLSKFL